MIELVAIGDGVDLELLDALSAQLARSLRDSCHVRPSPIDAAYAFDPVRRQHNSTAILGRLAAHPAADSRLLGIAAVDLFVPIFTFVFGEAQLSAAVPWSRFIGCERSFTVSRAAPIWSRNVCSRKPYTSSATPSASVTATTGNASWR